MKKSKVKTDSLLQMMNCAVSLETPETNEFWTANEEQSVPVQRAMQKLERQRNILVAELRRTLTSYGHKSAPGCGCSDCRQIRPIEDALDAVRHLQDSHGG